MSGVSFFSCAAGNTEACVNGRELHKRDLELLAGRGLPRDKNRSYILDISGRILDGESGEELKSLGKLAPTVDKVKHGFDVDGYGSVCDSDIQHRTVSVFEFVRCDNAHAVGTL
uniref:Uncharacterized protein n=1 Tax=Brassica oleracea TaxID=3712 RepID=A0A3P6HA79_BRAOL|nr:unnamed protein product [Brassica oleracea]